MPAYYQCHFLFLRADFDCAISAREGRAYLFSVKRAHARQRGCHRLKVFRPRGISCEPGVTALMTRLWFRRRGARVASRRCRYFHFR